MAFKSLIPPTPTRPKCESQRPSSSHRLNQVLSNNFHSTTLLLVGAILQGTLILIVPRIWVLLPSILTLLIRFADALAVTFHFRPNPYLEDAIHEKWTTIIPDADGNFSDIPADEKVAVLLLSAKVNHPLGIFAPNVKDLGARSQAMIKKLDSEDPTNGFLGETSYTTTDVRGGQELMGIYYFRSIEDIHNFAAGPLHLEAIDWWNSATKNDPENMKHIGISHEIFEAPRSKWETVSLNFQPTRLGATSYLRKGDKLIGGVVDDQWISPVVAARGRLARSHGRLNWSNHVNSSASSSDNEKE